jgi:Cof subfamily protein (haloacid dehalogenase superfamily)
MVHGQDQMRTTGDQIRPVRGVVLDVDGTVLDPAHRVAPSTRAAVARARAAGMHVVLASGRSARAMLGVMDELGLSGPAIAFNGALTFELEDGAPRALDAHPLDRGAAAAALRLVHEHGIEAGWFTLDGWRVRALGAGAAEEAGLTGEAPVVSPGLPDDGSEAPLKLMCIATSRAGSAALHALRDRLPAGVAGLFSHPRYLELTAPGVDKARAVRAACARLGLQPSDLAAIGDAENDIAMLRQAGVAFAMGNAAPAVLEAAPHRTAANDRDGVALAIDALLAAR